jgi:hypothetical protein
MIDDDLGKSGSSAEGRGGFQLTSSSINFSIFCFCSRDSDRTFSKLEEAVEDGVGFHKSPFTYRCRCRRRGGDRLYQFERVG